MELFVDAYKKNPLKNAWTYSHGFTSGEQRDEYVLIMSTRATQYMARAYKIPSDYVPNPRTYSFDEIALSCPKIYSEFMSIPF